MKISYIIELIFYNKELKSADCLQNVPVIFVETARFFGTPKERAIFVQQILFQKKFWMQNNTKHKLIGMQLVLFRLREKITLE